MKLRWDKWIYGLAAAIIGGGASSVTGGITSIAVFHVDVTTWEGAKKILTGMAVNFALSGILSMFFYLKQDPVPQVANGDTTTVTKTP